MLFTFQRVCRGLIKMIYIENDKRANACLLTESPSVSLRTLLAPYRFTQTISPVRYDGYPNEKKSIFHIITNKFGKQKKNNGKK